jgi:hypothetical protein
MRWATKSMVLTIGLMSLALGSSRGGEEDQLRRLVNDLGDSRYTVRRQAEGALRRQSALVLPLLDKQATQNLEQRMRLERVLSELRRLPWHHDLPAAQQEARTSGKPMLVFSTFGEVHGFG